MGKKNKILVPEAKSGLNQLKADIAKSQNPDDAKFEIAEEKGIQLNRGYNGSIKSKDAGEIGGQIGGQMVQELINMAKKRMQK